MGCTWTLATTDQKNVWTGRANLATITGNGPSLGASRSVLPIVRFSFAAQTLFGLENDHRSQAKQDVHGVAVAPHPSHRAIVAPGSDTRHAAQIHDLFSQVMILCRGRVLIGS
jgi:hypothetical protein